MHVDSGATRATLVRPPRHRSPSATEDGGSIANPGLNRYIQHGSEPPRSKLGQTWFIDHEAHLLQSRVIVNSHSSKNRYSGTIPRNHNYSLRLADQVSEKGIGKLLAKSLDFPS